MERFGHSNEHPKGRRAGPTASWARRERTPPTCPGTGFRGSCRHLDLRPLALELGDKFLCVKPPGYRSPRKLSQPTADRYGVAQSWPPDPRRRDSSHSTELPPVQSASLPAWRAFPDPESRPRGSLAQNPFPRLRPRQVMSAWGGGGHVDQQGEGGRNGRTVSGWVGGWVDDGWRDGRVDQSFLPLVWPDSTYPGERSYRAGNLPQTPAPCTWQTQMRAL